MEPVGGDQAQPDPDSTHKGKQRGAGLIPATAKANPGAKDDKIQCKEKHSAVQR